MTRICVRLGERSYPIYLADSYEPLAAILKKLQLARWGWLISHRSLLIRFGQQLLGPLRRAGVHLETIAVPESERSKSYAMAERLVHKLARQGAMRVPVLFAFGGGVIGDLTGFVAAVFRRGIPYVQLPTTLLAQVDSAIGGKVGVDLPFAKNLIGAFYQPRLVFNHLGLLGELPVRQRRSGLAEVIKYAVIVDSSLFRFIEEHVEECLAGELDTIRVLVERCCRIKARMVEQDEREAKGIRTRLNFGHTLGHALEAATGYRRFTHGEAISIGMACASYLSLCLGLMPRADHARIIRLMRNVGLPTHAAAIGLRAVKQALMYDKKFIHRKPRWVLPLRIGQVMVSESVGSSAMWRIIRQYVT